MAKCKIKRTSKMMVLGIIISLLMTGCADPMPELTEEENSIIAQYAATVLLKYDKKSTSRLTDIDFEAVKEAEQQELEATVDAVAQDDHVENSSGEVASEGNEADENGDLKNDDLQNSDSQNAEDIIYLSAGAMADVLGFGNLTFQFISGEIGKSYPLMNDNVYYACDAASGKSFLILHFQMQNIGSEENSIAMNAVNAKFELQSETGKIYSSTTSLSPYDMNYYKGTLGIDEQAEAVLLFEIPDEEIEALGNYTLVITRDQQVNYIKCEN